MALTNPRNEVTVSGLAQVVSGIRTWVENSAAAHSAYRVDGDTWAGMVEHGLGADSGSYVMTASYVYDEIQNIYSEINSANSATSADMEVIAAALNDLDDRVNATSGKADKVVGAISGNFAGLDENGNLIDSNYKPSDFKLKQTDVELNGSTIKTVTKITQNADGVVSAAFADIRTASTSQTGVVQLKNSIDTTETDTTKAVTPKAVKDAIDAAVSNAYHHAGTKTVAQLVSSLLVAANEGNVYNITDSGVTTSDFIEGAGLPIEPGDNVGICKDSNTNTYKFDLLSGFVDLTGYKTKQTPITSAALNALKTVQSIGQNENGELTISYQDIQSATSGQKGVVQLATTIGATVASENNKAATEKAVRDAIDALNVPSKADKVTGATSGHLAMLDSNGNLKDSGKFTTDFATAAQGAKADSAIQGVKLVGYALTPDANKVVNIPLATSAAHGLMSSADKSKLDAIAASAEVNQNAFSNIKIGSSTIEADQKTDTLEIVASGGLSVSADVTNDKVVFNLPMMTTEDVNEILSLLS